MSSVLDGSTNTKTLICFQFCTPTAHIIQASSAAGRGPWFRTEFPLGSCRAPPPGQATGAPPGLAHFVLRQRQDAGGVLRSGMRLREGNNAETFVSQVKK